MQSIASPCLPIEVSEEFIHAFHLYVSGRVALYNEKPKDMYYVHRNELTIYVNHLACRVFKSSNRQSGYIILFFLFASINLCILYLLMYSVIKIRLASMPESTSQR